MVEGDVAWLVDASYRSGKITLRLIRASDCEPISSTASFQPYYLTDAEDPQGVPVRKVDLFTQKTLSLNRVNYFGKVVKAVQAWETGVSPALSYVYDNGLRFGVLHRFEAGAWKPQAKVQDWQRPTFDALFEETKSKDPVKFKLVEEAFSRVTQPVPRVNPGKLGLQGFSEDDYYGAFLLSRVANLPVHRFHRNPAVSEWIRSMLHSYYRVNGILIPNSEELRLGDDREMVEGGLTLTPESGNYFNMVVLDYESLFPGCIDVFNLSYETVRCPHPECRQNQVPGLSHWVCTRRRGMYSALVGSLRDLRIRYFKSLTGSSREAVAATRILKLFLVSCYGVTIRIHGLASPLLAESITAYGRHVLKSTWEMAKDTGLSPRYGDTDSIFLNNPSEQGVKELVRSVKNKFGLELAHDRIYQVCVLSAAKKAYFGITPNGEPDIKGIAITKSNSPPFFQKTFNQCLTTLSAGRHSDKEFEHAKKVLPILVRDAIHELREGRVGLQDLEYSVRLREDPDQKSKQKNISQPYQAALLRMKTGKQVYKGDTVGFIKVTPFKVGDRKFTVKPTEQTTRSQVSVSEYVRNLYASLDQTFTPMNVNLDVAQTKLTQFTQP